MKGFLFTKPHMKGYSLIITIVLQVLLFSNITHALGISPGTQEVIFQEGLVQSYELNILPSGNEFGIHVFVSGELEQYFSIKEPDQIIGAEGGIVTYTLNLPQAVRPGDYKTFVVVERRNIVRGAGAGQSGFGATEVIAHAVTVHVPPAEKYIDLALFVDDAKMGEPVNFMIKVNNYGYKNIDNAKGVIDIYNTTKNNVMTVKTDEFGISTSSYAELRAYWVPINITPGQYWARATVYYDGMTREANKEFRIGDIRVNINGIEPQELTAGQINKFSVKVASMWSSPIQNIRGKVSISGMNKSETINTPTIDLGPWGTDELTGFWDATDYPTGTYTAQITLNYADKTTTEEFRLKLNPAPPKTELRTPENDKSINPATIIISILSTVAILSIIFISLFIFLRKKQRKQ